MLEIKGNKRLIVNSVKPSEPLWMRVPSHDEHGLRVSDFQMLIKGLKSRSLSEVEQCLEHLQSVLIRHQKHVVFADLNLKINLLWVSVRSGSRIGCQIAAEIHHLIPEAKLLSDVAGIRNSIDNR